MATQMRILEGTQKEKHSIPDFLYYINTLGLFIQLKYVFLKTKHKKCFNSI